MKLIKLYIFFLFFIIINTTTFSKAAENKKIFYKKDLLITAVILINPVVSVGTIFSNANVISKVLSIGNLAYASKKGETIKFKVYNFGEFVHEFNIATKKMHLKHQPEMMKLVENEILLGDKIDKKKMKEMAKKDHSMSHSHANSVLLEPNEDGEIIWKFNTEAKLEAACNIPGHYETGMIAKIKY